MTTRVFLHPRKSQNVPNFLWQCFYKSRYKLEKKILLKSSRVYIFSISIRLLITSNTHWNFLFCINVCLFPNVRYLPVVVKVIVLLINVFVVFFVGLYILSISEPQGQRLFRAACFTPLSYWALENYLLLKLVISDVCDSSWWNLARAGVFSCLCWERALSNAEVQVFGVPVS